ncbi:hypothetical protein [Actinoplanes auranticolor]|uniref:Uncharacterized protein n=1 Tax=Actinoplanes auranticolor TaxID=47988 RepID=A0A919S908_9ACTN|nr:hypothetical protein [Actinoplanes auranticolor]GIM67360.1 hypothetical protein Aau02nite_27060 [Actinoplanes auranticolor]
MVADEVKTPAATTADAELMTTEQAATVAGLTAEVSAAIDRLEGLVSRR